MEVVINLFRRFFADSRYVFNIFEACLCHRLGRTEIIEQRLLAAGADSLDGVKLRPGYRFAAFFAVGADGETMRL